MKDFKTIIFKEDKPLQLLKDNGFRANSDLNYCTDSGIEYYIGYNKNVAAIVAKIHDEDIYFISKDELSEMSFTAKVRGIDIVILYTNYGLELHSKYDTPQVVGLDKIIKLLSF